MQPLMTPLLRSGMQPLMTPLLRSGKQPPLRPRTAMALHIHTRSCTAVQTTTTAAAASARALQRPMNSPAARLEGHAAKGRAAAAVNRAGVPATAPSTAPATAIRAACVRGVSADRLRGAASHRR
jgi:hypothetical protein